MRGARIYFGVRVEGLSEDRSDLRDSAAGGNARIGPFTGADLHAFDKGDYRARRKHFFRADGRDGGTSAGGEAARHQSGDLSQRRGTCGEPRDYYCGYEIRIWNDRRRTNMD